MAKPELRFRSDGTFRILQLTDLHLVDVAGRDAVLLSQIPELIAREQPDLIALTGDIACDGSAADMVEQFSALYHAMESAGVPITMTLGNHESDPASDGSCRQHLLADALEAFPLCLFERGPAELGVGNYAVPIFPHTGEKRPAWMLYHIDCHSGEDEPLPDAFAVYKDAPVRHSQIAWLQQTHRALQDACGAVPALLFDHVPLPEFDDLWMFEGFHGDMGERVCRPPINTGLFSALLQLQDFRGVFAGHDHTNSCSGEVFGILLAYGRCSGNLGWCLWPHPHALQSEALPHPADGRPPLSDCFARGGRVIDLNEATGRIDRTYIARYDHVSEAEGWTPPRFTRSRFLPSADAFSRN